MTSKKQKCPRVKLRTLRTRLNETQAEFAARLGCSSEAIVRYESTDPLVQRRPCADIRWKLYEVTEALGAPIAPPEWSAAP